MDVDEGAGLHVQVRHAVEGVVAEDEVVEGGEEEEVVEGLLVLVGEKRVLDYQETSQVCRIVRIAVPTEVVPDTILIICDVKV